MRYSKHHKTAEIAKLPRAMIAGGATALVLVAVALALTAPQPSTRKALPAFTMPVPSLLAKAPAALDNKPLRLVYRNSVVPGGMHSAAELVEVMGRDPVAAAHYANFKVSAAHLVRVEKSRMVHVSYRIGKQIYWTKNKVRLALGETLLSDGEHLIRARCGNRIADSIDGPVLLNEPAPEVLETAFVSADDLIDDSVSMSALGGLPAGPATAADNAAVERVAPLARSLSFERMGLPTLARLDTLPGVTVLAARSTPAQVIDGGATQPAGEAAPLPVATPAPAPAAENAAGTPPVSAGGTPPAVPVLFPVLDNLPTGDTASTPIEVKTDVPGKGAPETPFIDGPTFSPAPPVSALPAVEATVPEPGTGMLTMLALGLMVLMAAVRRRR